MKKLLAFLFLFSFLLVACNKDNSEPLSSPEYLGTEIHSFEGIGDVKVQFYNDKDGELVRDFGDFQNEIDNFYLANPNSVTYIKVVDEKDIIIIAKNKDSKLLPDLSKEVEDIKGEDNSDLRGACQTRVTFYKDANYFNRELDKVNLNWSYSNANMKSTWSTAPTPLVYGYNDMASSVILRGPSMGCPYSGVRVTMYRDKDFQSNVFIVEAPKGYARFYTNLKWYGFNDKMSSYKMTLIY